MSVTLAITSTYEDKPPLEAPKNKANSKPISNPAIHRLYRRLPSEYISAEDFNKVFKVCNRLWWKAF